VAGWREARQGGACRPQGIVCRWGGRHEPPQGLDGGAAAQSVSNLAGLSIWRLAGPFCQLRWVGTGLSNILLTGQTCEYLDVSSRTVLSCATYHIFFWTDTYQIVLYYWSNCLADGRIVLWMVYGIPLRGILDLDMDLKGLIINYLIIWLIIEEPKLSLGEEFYRSKPLWANITPYGPQGLRLTLSCRNKPSDMVFPTMPKV
jgi:hypothetical protein